MVLVAAGVVVGLVVAVVVIVVVVVVVVAVVLVSELIPYQTHMNPTRCYLGLCLAQGPP